MAKIIDIKKAAFDRLDARLGRQRPDFDYAGVTRVHDAANLSPTDEVILSAKTFVRVMAMLAAFQLDGTPRTWAQLRGNHLYCERMEMLAAGVRIAPMRTLEEACAVYEGQYPGISAPLLLFITGDKEGLRSWHRANGTFERNAREYDGDYDEEWEFGDEPV